MLTAAVWGDRCPVKEEHPIVQQLQSIAQLQSRLWTVLAVTKPLPPGVGCACQILLLASWLPETCACHISSERVISFGFSPRDTLTLTAMGTQNVLCIQRELLSVSGQKIEPQEIPLPPGTGPRKLEQLLAEAALLLILDG